MNRRITVKLSVTFVILGCFIFGVLGHLSGKPPVPPEKPKESQEKPTKEVISKKEWGPELNGCQMKIKVDNEKFNPCTPIVISVYIKNVGKTPLPFILRNSYLDTTFEVKDEKGNTVPETSFGKWILNAEDPGGLSGCDLDNGEEIDITFLINRLYDMTKEGTYLITARFKVPKRDDKGNPIRNEDKSIGTRMYEMIELTSNTIEVQVRW